MVARFQESGSQAASCRIATAARWSVTGKLLHTNGRCAYTPQRAFSGAISMRNTQAPVFVRLLETNDEGFRLRTKSLGCRSVPAARVRISLTVTRTLYMRQQRPLQPTQPARLAP